MAEIINKITHTDTDSVKTVNFTNYNSSIFNILDELGFEEKLKNNKKIIIKPNLLEVAPPPCTTDVRCIEAVIKYIIERKAGSTNLIVIEGSGGCNTRDAYNSLGYLQLRKKYNINLLDVDECRPVKLTNRNALVYKEIYLPEDIFNSFFISIPSLKCHSITTVTLGLKNLIGLLPKKYYGKYWSYNRSDVHRVGVDRAIVDLNTYIKINLTIIDGRIGQIGSHLPGGRQCQPAKNIIIGGYNSFEVDKTGSEILGYSWKDVRHLKLFEKEII